MNEPDQPSPLDDLNKRLRDARSKHAPDEPDDKERSGSSGGLGLGFRVAIDLVAGVAVGVFVGWLLDRWLGTTPWLMLVFFFLGAAAGFSNVLRAERASRNQRK
ncbi:MAG: AtpZ/AtpI family protein [Alphaproteobacteria bacterium]|nr:AtpZ/AtpI family protein [Alphaproteobacteria bacterium]